MNTYLQSYTTVCYRIVNAETGYWLSGEFTHKENAIKEVKKRKTRLEASETSAEHIVLVEYTQHVDCKLVEV